MPTQNRLRLSVLPLLLQLLQWTAYVKVWNNLSFQRWLQQAMALALPVRNLSFSRKQMAFVVWLWCHTTQLPIDLQKVPFKMWSKGWRRPHKVFWLHVCIAKVLYRLTPQGTYYWYLPSRVAARLKTSIQVRSRETYITLRSVWRIDSYNRNPSWHDSWRSYISGGGRGDPVDFSKGETWLPGCIVKHTSSVSFQICGHDGKTYRWHQDHLQPRQCKEVPGTDQSVPELSVDASSLEAMPTHPKLLLLPYIMELSERIEKMCRPLGVKSVSRSRCTLWSSLVHVKQSREDRFHLWSSMKRLSVCLYWRNRQNPWEATEWTQECSEEEWH